MSVLDVVLTGWAVAATLFSGVAGVRLSLRARRRDGPPASMRSETLPEVPVLLLRPLDQPTPRECDNLALPLPSHVRQIVLSPARFGVSLALEWMPSDPRCANRKVGHVLHALATLDAAEVEQARVLVVDSDVAVDAALVDALVSGLSSGADLCWAAPDVESGKSFAGKALAGLLNQTHHSFVALEAMSVGAKAVCGKALGLGARAQRELGRLGEHIGEDLELSARLHLSGATVQLASARARIPRDDTYRWSTAVSRMTRWMQVLRSHRPALSPTVPLLFTPTVPLVVLALLVQTTPVSVAVVGLVLVRVLLAQVLAGGERGTRREALFDWFLGELLLAVAFAYAFGRRTVSWRGNSFTLEPGGRMARRAPLSAAEVVR